MFLEIVSPEATLFGAEVTSVAVPGINGDFQMLENHAPIVSLLNAGKVRIQGNGIEIAEMFQDLFTQDKGNYILEIKGGTIEMNNNKIMILAD